MGVDEAPGAVPCGGHAPIDDQYQLLGIDGSKDKAPFAYEFLKPASIELNRKITELLVIASAEFLPARIQQNLVFDSNSTVARAVANAATRLEPLQGYFALNKSGDKEFAHTLSYTEMPKHYSWKKAERLWLKRATPKKSQYNQVYW